MQIVAAVGLPMLHHFVINFKMVQFNFRHCKWFSEQCRSNSTTAMDFRTVQVKFNHCNGFQNSAGQIQNAANEFQMSLPPRYISVHYVGKTR